MGVPATLANLLTPIGAFCLVQLLWRHGAEYPAAYSLALRLEALCLVPFLAYSSVAGPLFGISARGAAVGGEWTRRIGVCQHFILRRGALLAVLMAGVTLSLSGWLDSCPLVLPALTQYALLVPLSYGAYGLVMTYNAAFNCLAIPLAGLSVAAIRCLLLAVPLAWLLGHLLGGIGIFLAIACSNVAAAAIAHRLMLSPLPWRQPALCANTSTPT